MRQFDWCTIHTLVQWSDWRKIHILMRRSIWCEQHTTLNANIEFFVVFFSIKKTENLNGNRVSRLETRWRTDLRARFGVEKSRFDTYLSHFFVFFDGQLTLAVLLMVWAQSWYVTWTISKRSKINFRINSDLSGDCQLGISHLKISSTLISSVHHENWVFGIELQYGWCQFALFRLFWALVKSTFLKAPKSCVCLTK